MRRILATVGIVVMAIALLTTGCGGGEEEPTPTPTSPPTETPVPPTDTPMPPTDTAVPPTVTPEEPAATATPETQRERVTLLFQSAVGSIEDAERVLDILLEEDGVLDGRADEISMTITYDPEVITVEDMREIVEAEGIPLQE